MSQNHLSVVCDLIDKRITGEKYLGLRTLAHAYAASGIPKKVRDVLPDLEMGILTPKDQSFPLGFVVSAKIKSTAPGKNPLRPLFSVIHKGSVSHPDEENTANPDEFISNQLRLTEIAKDVVHLYPLFDRLKMIQLGLWKALTDTVVVNEKDMRFTVRLANGTEADMELSINYGTIARLQNDLDTLKEFRTETGREMTMGEILAEHGRSKGL